MAPIRRLAVAAVAALTMAATAACGDAAGSTNPNAAPNPSTDGPIQIGTVCELLSSQAVAEFLSQPAEIDKATMTECVWMATDRGSHQVRLQTFDAYGFFAPSRWGGDSESIEGLGAEAYLIRTGTSGTVAAYWDGQRAYVLSYVLLVGSGSSQDRADDLVELLRDVAAGR